MIRVKKYNFFTHPNFVKFLKSLFWTSLYFVAPLTLSSLYVTVQTVEQGEMILPSKSNLSLH